MCASFFDWPSYKRKRDWWTLQSIPSQRILPTQSVVTKLFQLSLCCALCMPGLFCYMVNKNTLNTSEHLPWKLDTMQSMQTNALKQSDCLVFFDTQANHSDQQSDTITMLYANNLSAVLFQCELKLKL